MKTNKAAWVEVSGDALAYNLETVRSRLKQGTRLCAVIKGNAYGHGLTGVKKLLSERKLADMTAVGKSSEMLRILRKTEDDGCDVLLLGMAEEKEVEALLKRAGDRSSRAVFSIYNLRQFRGLNALGKKLKRKIRVHIRVDIWNSGMGLGFDEFRKREDELFQAEGIAICGLYGHLYSGYYEENKEETRRELQEFDELVKGIHPDHRSQLIVHVLNSSLVFSFPEYSYDMVRVGTAMYGLTCGDGGILKPVMKLCGRIFDVREIKADTPLSYQHADGAVGTRKIARIMIGYCDCPMLLTQKDVRIRIHDRVFPLADEICMDNLCIDVTGCEEVKVGDTAVLLGEPGVLDVEILDRNNMEYVHSDWLTMTAERLEKEYV
ncbi:MAG: alanine racemase [Solobacterium sp.]|nr:alanine racemase [Solobacterium sp.]